MNTPPPIIFDRAAYRARRARAEAAHGDIFLAQDMAGRLAERLDAVNRRFERGLDVDGRPRAFPTFERFASSWEHATLAGETLPAAEASFDLAVSVLSLHAVNDLPGLLVQIRRALKPDGLFMAALFGGETLHELKAAFAAAEAETLGGISPRVAPFGDVRALGGLLSRAGFALPVADVERLTVQYRDVTRLFADLRALGETNPLAGRRNTLLSRRTLNAVVHEYAQRFTDDEGRYVATFDVVFLTGWAPHDSQPKPLKPGSAAARLADALGTKEIPTGEKPG